MAQTLSYTDVFVPGGNPKYTYNPRSALSLETKVGEVLQNLCKLVIVTGHTKSGKTVLVKKVLPRERAIWIDGGTIREEEDFWNTIVAELGLFQSKEIAKTQEENVKISGSTAVEGNAFIAKANAKVGSSITATEASITTHSQNLSSRIIALKELREKLIPIVIDDFHYLPRELQGHLIRTLKPLIFDGLPVVVIAIPHRRYDAIKVEKEMTGRIFPIDIPLWSTDELKYIPDTGFELLNKNVGADTKNYLSREAIGSPHLIQEFCRELCKISIMPMLKTDTDKAFEEAARRIGRPIFEKLARGPRQRADRIPRKLKSGLEVDIYGLVLHSLAHIKPSLQTLEYEDLRNSIKEICEADSLPQLQEVARVLKHMSEIAATDESSVAVIDFDEEDKLLHITDPFFAFYLRWGNLEDQETANQSES